MLGNNHPIPEGKMKDRLFPGSAMLFGQTSDPIERATGAPRSAEGQGTFVNLQLPEFPGNQMVYSIQQTVELAALMNRVLRPNRRWRRSVASGGLAE